MDTLKFNNEIKIFNKVMKNINIYDDMNNNALSTKFNNIIGD